MREDLDVRITLQNYMMKKITSALLLAALLPSCVSTPEPKPVAAIRAGDTSMSCKELEVEYQGNTEAAVRKIAKNKSGDVKDAVIGLLIWPGLADFNNAPGHEGNALLDRNARLKSLAEAKGCTTSHWPEQPKRY